MVHKRILHQPCKFLLPGFNFQVSLSRIVNSSEFLQHSYRKGITMQFVENSIASLSSSTSGHGRKSNPTLSSSSKPPGHWRCSSASSSRISVVSALVLSIGIRVWINEGREEQTGNIYESPEYVSYGA